MKRNTEHISLKDIDEWTVKALGAIVGRIEAIDEEIASLTNERKALEVRRKIYEAASTSLKPHRRKAKAKKRAVKKSSRMVHHATIIDFVTKKRREVATLEVAKHFRMTRNAAYQHLWKAEKLGVIAKANGGKAWVAA